MKTTIRGLGKYVDQEVTLSGWLNNKRSSGSLAFLEIRDGSGFIQAIVNKSEVAEEVWNDAERMTQESSLSVTGLVKAHPKKVGEYEIQVKGIRVYHISEEYPIAKKEHGPDFLMEHRHLWLRSKRQWAILRVRDVIETAVNEYLHQEGFIRTDSPVFTPNACEGTTTLFGVPYFDLGNAYLSQSGQLYSEATIFSAGRVYDFGPVFRAEKSKTKRHLTEFWMMDAEAAFVEHDENMDIQEGLIKYIVRSVLEKCEYELAMLERNTEPLKKLLDKPFTRLTYDEAIPKLREMGSDIQYGEDLGNDDEGLLTQESDVPVFIHRWPKSIKPFYVKRAADNDALALNVDMIGIEGSGEIIGGAQREEDIEVLLERIKNEGLNEEDYDWYLDLRRYGSVPHSGFGLGLERVVRWLTQAEHIRECIPFPRLLNRIKP
jgi:asparaginyl-tRNA synthetase